MPALYSAIKLIALAVMAGLLVHFVEVARQDCGHVFEGLGTGAVSCAVSVGLAWYQRQRPPIEK